MLQFVCKDFGHACAVSTRFDQVCKKMLLFDTFCSVLFGLTFAGGPSKAPGRAMSAEGVRPGVASFVARGRPWIRWWNAKRQDKNIKMTKPIATIYMKHHETIWTYLDGLELGTSWNILEHLGTSWNLRLTLLSESFFLAHPKVPGCGVPPVGSSAVRLF